MRPEDEHRALGIDRLDGCLSIAPGCLPVLILLALLAIAIGALLAAVESR